MSPETPIQDIVDRSQVWESHADTEVWRFGKPGTERVLPTYTVDELGRGMADRMVASVTVTLAAPSLLETLLRRLLPTPVVPPSPLKTVPSEMEGLLRRLLGEVQAPKPALPAKSGIANLKTLLEVFVQARRGHIRQDWATIVCFSCGKA